MSAYSIAGYAVALWQRARKTILVEGQTDKRLLDRLNLERCLNAGSQTNCDMDQVEIISDTALSQMGNKDRVIHVANNVVAIGVPGVQQKLNYLVDREWDGITLNPVPQMYTAPQGAAWGFCTKGHSLENYALDSAALTSFLKMHYAGNLPLQFFVILRQRYPEMLRLALAISLAARALQVLTRCDGLFRVSDVSWNGVRYELRNTINAKLVARGSNADLHGATYTQSLDANLATCPIDVMRWLCHGHVGEQVVRACAANLAEECHASAETIANVDTGRKADKLLHDADHLSSLPAAEVDPLADLMAWAS